jgi:hypothetical protein
MGSSEGTDGRLLGLVRRVDRAHTHPTRQLVKITYRGNVDLGQATGDLTVVARGEEGRRSEKREARKGMTSKGWFFTTLAGQRPEPRNGVAVLTMAELGRLEKSLEGTLIGSLEGTTWKGYAAQWYHAENFCLINLGEQIHEVGAVLYVHHRLTVIGPRGKKIGLTTAYRYAKGLSAVAGRLPLEDRWRMDVLGPYKTALVKMGANLPEGQAYPITREQVYHVVDNPENSMEIRVNMIVGWKASARADDLQKLRMEDIVEYRSKHGRRYLILRWRPNAQKERHGSGRLKSDRNGLGNSCVLDFETRPDLYDMVTRYTRGKSGPFSKRSTAWFNAMMKRIDPKLSAHSPKRGSLQYAMELEEEEITLELIVAQARHQSKLGLPMSTRTYLPPIGLAIATGTQRLTRYL